MVIDATGKLVLPGCDRPAHPPRHAVRRHRHGRRLHIGQTAAAFGGTTCHVDFAIQTSGESLERRGRRRGTGKRDGKALIDYGFHVASPTCPTAVTPRWSRRSRPTASPPTRSSWPTRARCMVDDEHALPRSMQIARETGGLVMVHAENGDAIDVLVRRRRSPRGDTDAAVWHARTRPPSSRGRPRTARSSSRESPARRCTSSTSPARRRSSRSRSARATGWRRVRRDVHRSTSSSTRRPRRGPTSRARSTSTRRRCAKANQHVLWDAVRTDVLSGDLDRPLRVPLDGQKTMGKDDFTKIPNGGPGLEDRLRMIHHFGVREGRISLNRMVELLCDEPGPALRALPAEGHDRAGLRRRPRDLRPERNDDDLGREPALEVGLQPLRGHRGDAATSTPCSSAAPSSSTGASFRVEPGFGRYVARARFGEELA